MSLLLDYWSPEIIMWRSKDEQQLISSHYKIEEFPGVIGTVDGTHFKINKASEDAEYYYNRRHYFSIQVTLHLQIRISIIN